MILGLFLFQGEILRFIYIGQTSTLNSVTPTINHYLADVYCVTCIHYQNTSICLQVCIEMALRISIHVQRNIWIPQMKFEGANEL